MISPVTRENLFWQIFNHANKIDYNLVQIYGEDLANIFETQAKFLLQDARVIDSIRSKKRSVAEPFLVCRVSKRRTH
jgi:hypothetical protein